MAVFDHDEQEQLSQIRDWWGQYGNLVTTALTVVAVAVVGWQGYRWYQGNQAAQAAGLYAAVEHAQATEAVAQLRDAAGTLIDQSGATVYAELAVLTAAHGEVQGGDSKNALAQLQWLVEHGSDPALQAVGRLRLAALQIDQKQYDVAQQTLSVLPPAAFAARFADLRGDALLGAGKPAEARKAYQEALDSGSGSMGRDPLREAVQLKLDTLAGGK